MALTANVLPRGVRNNNPLNIEHNDNNKWLGLANPPSDGRFARFVSMDYGIRAAACLLMKYYDKDKLTSVAQIITKWAPPTENNVNAYATAVCRRMEVGLYEELDLHDRDTMYHLVAAMAKHENGQDIDDIAVNRGITMAGYPAPNTTDSVMATPTMFAASTVAAVPATIGVLSIIDAVMDNVEIVPGIVTALGGPAAGGIAMGVVTALTWAYQLYNRMQIRSKTGV